MCGAGRCLAEFGLRLGSNTSRSIRSPLFAHGRLVSDAMFSGIRISLFQASQQASVMAS
jgi:hypothetical protein